MPGKIEPIRASIEGLMAGLCSVEAVDIARLMVGPWADHAERVPPLASLESGVSADFEHDSWGRLCSAACGYYGLPSAASSLRPATDDAVCELAATAEPVRPSGHRSAARCVRP